MQEQAKEKLRSSKLPNTAMKVVVDYLIDFIKDDVFASKVLNEKKSVDEMIEYIMSEAKKLASGNMAMVSDEQVYNWAVHYFDEENIKFDKVAGTIAKDQVDQPVQKQKKEKKKDDSIFMTLDLFGDEDEDVEDDEE